MNLKSILKTLVRAAPAIILAVREAKRAAKRPGPPPTN